jgi:hypothetical protein
VDSRVLFSGKHIYDLVEERREQLKVAYDALPDDEALHEATTQALKKKFMLDVPTLRMNDWTSEREEISPYATEITAYIPFDGDPAVFYVQPSAFNGMLAYGEIVNHELLVRIRPNSANFDVPTYVRSQLKEVEWRLNSLRSSMEHMSQQLEITLREGMQRRRRMIENRVKLADNIGIPQRPPKTAPVVAQKAAPAPTKPVNKKEPKLESWDVFMSHASPDKPYVRGLVKALRDGGVTVWFDEDHIEWGESVPREIRKGLLNSRYGIVVLSEAYLAERKWTEHEFQGLLARETLDTTVILPIWHKVTEEDVKKYDAPLTLRRAKISETDAYPDIVASIQRKLGHEVSVSDKTASPGTDRPVKDGPEDRELVAYAEYETTGPSAEFVKIFVRKSSFMKGGFVLIDGKNEHDGTMEDVGSRFLMGDRYLKNKGFVRMRFSNPSNLTAFEL